jgi:hypothetical protein
MTERKKPSEMRRPGEAVVIQMPSEATPQQTKPNEPQRVDMRRYLYSGPDIAKLPPVRFMLANRLVRGGITALYAPPKCGKSFAAVDLALEAALGGSFWGEMFGEPLTVLYIAAERAADTRDRVEAACKRRGIPFPASLHLLAKNDGPPKADNLAHLAGLQELAREMKPHLVIFDTYARMSSHDQNRENETDAVAEYFRSIVQAAGSDSAGLIIHHQGKDASKGLRGSTALLGAVDAVWRILKERDSYRLEVEAINSGTPPLPAYFTITSEQLDPAPGDDEARSVGVVVWRDYAEVAEAKDKLLLDLLTQANSEGLSATEAAELYNEQAGTTYKADTVGRWLARLVKLNSCEARGNKRARRFYAKGETAES